ncbi:MAG: CdaR family protein [Terriglobales bacterium]
MASLWRRVFVQNFLLKFVSLVLAVGMWMSVVHDPTASVEVRVPIEFNLPDNIVIDSSTFTQAQVLVRGPKRLLHRLEPGDVRASVDLSAVQPGERTFELHVHVPQDLEVVQIIPSQFHLTFDTRDTRLVEVRPRITGTFADGMKVGQISCDPPTVLVTGPHRRVEALESAGTDPVDASGTTTSGSFLTQVYVSDPLIQVVHPQPIRVTVMMEDAGREKKK